MIHLRSTVRPVLLATVCMLASSCSGLGPITSQIARAIPRYREPTYKGFDHQTVGIMCWADRGIRIDNPYLQLDVCAGVLEKLKKTQTEDKPKELEGTTFPISPRVIARYQEDHPEIEGLPITETASKFALSRLIYIEVNEFATRSEASLELFRGSMSGNLKIIEIGKDGKTKVVYEENDIHVSWPKNTPDEGLPVGTDYKIYTGTIDKFTTTLAHRLAPFEEDPDAKDE